MPADSKPGGPPDVPPFLQKNAVPARPVAPAAEEPADIPLFLRPKQGAVPADKPAAPDAAAAMESKGDPGILSAEEVQRALMAAQAARARAEREAVESDLIPAAAAAAPAASGDKTPYQPIDWESAPAIFDQMVTGIRKDRAEYQREQSQKRSTLETDWLHVLDSMRELQRKVQGHRKLIYFNITRDSQEVAVKISDETVPHHYRHYTMTRRHPSGRYGNLEVIWLLEFAGRDRYFHDAKEAMAELVSRIAGALA